MKIFIERIVKWNEKRIFAYNYKILLRKHLSTNSINDLSMKTFRIKYKNHFDYFTKPIIRSKTILVAKMYVDQFIFSVINTLFFMMSTGIALDIVNEKKK